MIWTRSEIERCLSATQLGLVRRSLREGLMHINGPEVVAARVLVRIGVGKLGHVAFAKTENRWTFNLEDDVRASLETS